MAQATKTETNREVSDAEVKKLKKLLRSKNAVAIAATLQMIESLDATESDWAKIFDFDLVRGMVCPQLDAKLLLPIMEVANRRSAISVPLEELTLLRFKSSSAEKQNAFILGVSGQVTEKDSMEGRVLAACIPHMKKTESGWGGSCAKLDLRCPSILPDAAAELIANYSGCLLLDGLTTLSDQAAESLARHKETLSLNSLAVISDKAAASLSKHEGNLYLNGLPTLSGKAAAALSRHKHTLRLSGLKTLSAKAVKVLAAHEGRLKLHKLDPS